MEFELHSDLQRDGIRLGAFPLCLVLLINDRRYPWFVLVPQRSGLRELYDMSDQDYQVFCEESKRFSKAIMETFCGLKLNVAALGNMTPQLHIHHVVRFETDEAWPGPIWGVGTMTPYQPDEVDAVKRKIECCQLEEFTPA